MSFAARSQGLTKQDLKQMLAGWSSSGGETGSSADWSHSDADLSDDYGVALSSLEGGPPSLERRYKTEVPPGAFRSAGIAQSTPPTRSKDVIGDTPATAELTSDSTSGSDKDAPIIPKVRIPAKTRSSNRNTDDGEIDRSKHYEDPKSLTRKEAKQLLKKSSKDPTERERRVRRSKSADTGMLEAGMDEYERLAASMGLPVNLFTQGAIPAKKKQPGKASRRSSLSTSMHSTKKSKVKDSNGSAYNEKKSGKSRRRSSMSVSLHSVTDDEDLPAPTGQEQSSAVTDKEKAMSRLERIKAKAIKSASKELGLDEANLSAVMGMPSKPRTKTVSKRESNGPAMNDKRQNEVEEDAEMLYLAETLGLPPGIFGIKPKNTRDGDRSSMPSKKLQEVELTTKQKKSRQAPQQPSSTSLASFMGKNIDMAPGEVESNPDPTTEEKRAEKTKAMTRLERMKAKAIKSASKELGVDESGLAQLMGVSSRVPSVESQNSTLATRPDQRISEDEKQIEYLASSLGLPLSFFGVELAQQSKVPEVPEQMCDNASDESRKPKKLLQEVIRKVRVYDTETETEDDLDMNSTSSEYMPTVGATEGTTARNPLAEYSIPPKGANPFSTNSVMNTVTNDTSFNGETMDAIGFSPQPRSLADALGMIIDPSSRAPPVRQVHAALDYAQEGNTSVKQEALNATSSFNPQPGSLAEALGMVVDPSSRAPPIRRRGDETTPMFSGGTRSVNAKNSESVSEAGEFSPQPRSLADALGMVIDPSSRAPPIRQKHGSVNQGSEESTSRRQGAISSESKSKLGFNPQPGSLAEALGMVVDPSSRAPPIRQRDETAPTLFVDTTKTERPDANFTTTSGFAPQPRSLADALGMVVDPSSRAPPVRQMQAYARDRQPRMNVTSEKTIGFNPQPGSRVGTLGMVVDPSSRAPPIQRQVDERTLILSSDKKSVNSQNAVGVSPQPRSLADAVGMVVDPSSRAAPIRQIHASVYQGYEGIPAKAQDAINSTSKKRLGFNPQPGSLADALGMVVDPSSRAPPIRRQGDETNPNIEHVGFSPQLGSLADALGMVVDPSSRAPQIRQIHRSSDQAHDGSRSKGQGAINSISKKKIGFNPQPGSLADALGMVVDPSSRAPPIRRPVHDTTPIVSAETTVNDATHVNGTASVGFSPQPRSLADALGMVVDPSSRAPPIRQIHASVDQAHDGSMSTGQGAINSISRKKIGFNPQPGSLADALGMVVDRSSRAPPIRRQVDETTPIVSAETTVNDGIYVSVTSTVGFSPQPRSLADALGMVVDSSSRAPQIRQIRRSVDQAHDGSMSTGQGAINSISKKKIGFNPQPGSLADALGMVVDPSSRAPPIRQQGDETSLNIEGFGFSPQPRSLADALGMVVDSSSRAPQIRQIHRSADQEHGSMATGQGAINSISKKKIGFNPQPGSLADALGMVVDPSSRAPPIRRQGDEVTLALAGVISDNRSDRFLPQAGSLAEALGLSVDATDAEEPSSQALRGDVLLEPETSTASNLLRTQRKNFLQTVLTNTTSKIKPFTSQNLERATTTLQISLVGTW